MRRKGFTIGDHVVKVNWENRPLETGIVTDVEDSVIAHILFPSGIRWEYTHDLQHVDDVPPRKK